VVAVGTLIKGWGRRAERAVLWLLKQLLEKLWPKDAEW
jgi:hypothetical protein